MHDSNVVLLYTYDLLTVKCVGRYVGTDDTQIMSLSTSVTRFGEISPLWQYFISLGQIYSYLGK